LNAWERILLHVPRSKLTTQTSVLGEDFMLELWTDGSCYRNPGGPGGFSAILVKSGVEIVRVVDSEPVTTSNRMELSGVLYGLKEVVSGPVTVYSDSEYVVKIFSEWLSKWKQSPKKLLYKKNLDLIYAIESEIARVGDVSFKWVRGHSGIEWNEVADYYANKACMDLVALETHP